MIAYIIIKFPFRVSNCTLSERKVHNSIQCVAILFLFRPGGGGGGRLIVPALTLNVYTFYQKQAKPTKRGDLTFNLSGNNLPKQVLVYQV